ncbi:MAG: hypothetical protein AB8B85_08795 [Paracoccaceae bacterium]
MLQRHDFAPMNLAEHFFAKGWVRFAVDPEIAVWVDAVRPLAELISADPQHRAAWLRCGGTWFAGVNILPNNSSGAVPTEGVPPLTGAPVQFIRDVLGPRDFAWDAGQISVCYPGYPQPSDGESEAAFRFRRDRDAAHVDGLLRSGLDRRRSLGEPHGFVLGLPLTETPAEAAPLVVWEGSHEHMRAAFRARFACINPADWAAEDITEAYTAARREVFSACPRVPVHARPGEAYLVHRLALHGVSPWGAGGGNAPRSIAYFRPETSSEPGDWLHAK